MNFLKNIFLLFFCSVSLLSFSQNDSIVVAYQVDERAELMSIVFRLAGAEEYVTDNVPLYVNQIDSFFLPYINDEVINCVVNQRKNFGVSYDAVMSLAVHLTINNGSVKLIDGINLDEIDDRWQPDSIAKFVSLLNDFYHQSDFHTFFESHRSFYRHAEKNFHKNVIQGIDFKWYNDFYSEIPAEKFNIIISISNGGNNYGAQVEYENGSKELYAVIGTWGTDSLGFPNYFSRIRNIVIHEFNHSFCNPLIEHYLSDLYPQAEKLNEVVAEKMKKMHYGNPQTYLCESLVRACVIKYNASIQPEYKEMWVAQEQNSGFLCMLDLDNLLTKYENNREYFPTLRSFMPEIVKTFNSMNPKKLYKQFCKNQPVILGTNIKNGDQKVNPNIAEIVVKFDRPMNTNMNGSSFGKKGEEFMPDITDFRWNKNNKKEWILSVELQPNTEYSISFPAQFFYSEKGYYPPRETYWLDFKTK